MLAEVPDFCRPDGTDAYCVGLTGNNVSNENLKTVIIPKGIRKIGRGAFGGQAIETLSLPEGLQEIDASAFKGNHLSSLALPGTVTKVGNSAFEQGGAGGFLTSLFLSDGLKEIGSKAFARGALSRVDLPYGLQKMNKLAFDENQTVPVPAYTRMKRRTSRWKWREPPLPSKKRRMFWDGQLTLPTMRQALP
nr:leucine-rich repeat domain-containing protein [Suipraeoptans intestinalis]